MMQSGTDGCVEGHVSVGEANRGTKRRKPKERLREIKKKARYSDPFVEPHGRFPDWQQVCKHTINNDDLTTSGVFRCALLTNNDVKLFRKNLFANKTKTEQDKFLLLNIVSNPAARSRVEQFNLKRKREVAPEYFIKLTDGKRVRVCRQTFEEVVRPIGPTRITGVVNRHFKTGSLPTETRGGDRVLEKNLPKKQSVRKFISGLKARESHYGRNKSVRLYLPAELKSVRNLHCMYNATVEDALKVSHSMFYEIFTKEFNVGFNNPRVDVCTTCEYINSKIKAETDEEASKKHKVELKIHKTRAKAYYDIIRKKKDQPDTHVVAFDLQAVQVLPKAPIQEAYYSRQLGLYNLGLCDVSNGKNYSFTWTENQSERGSNEIASAVHHYLDNVLPQIEDYEQIKHLILTSDGCGGQNKNNIVLGMLQNWFFSTSSNIETITLLFPVRGHSFLPCDRLFGRIQHDLKKMDTIILPTAYHEVYRQHCDQVFVYPADWKVNNWKEQSHRQFKNLMNIQKAKRIILNKISKASGDKVVMVSNQLYYSVDTSPAVCLLKSSESYSTIRPPITAPHRLIAALKLKDICSLLEKLFGNNYKDDPRFTMYCNLASTAVDETTMPGENCQCLEVEPTMDLV